jgi:hypothetical protein
VDGDILRHILTNRSLFRSRNVQENYHPPTEQKTWHSPTAVPLPDDQGKSQKLSDNNTGSTSAHALGRTHRWVSFAVYGVQLLRPILLFCCLSVRLQVDLPFQYRASWTRLPRYRCRMFACCSYRTCLRQLSVSATSQAVSFRRT